ncbi:MAG TPA: VPDSG-CTERM sorting domain-containing protein [Verrucomicrobiae bacterium]|nr:VPDSG-CTERM sorting domain-containing protein [Verrucomicrobiae bacterium]
MKKTALFIGMATALAAGAVISAHADEVTFEDLTGPSTFAVAGAEQTLVYSFTGYTATFAGGVVLTGESNQTTDNSSVYATGSSDLVGGGPGLLNPLTVTFTAPIQNFQIQILNALAGNYEMFDNVGDSLNFSLATTGSSLQTEGFAAAGTMVSIEYLGGGGFAAGDWDFAIDNVTFNQPLSSTVPDGGTTIALLGVALLGLFAWRKFVWTTVAA